jgi:hypothetical protein
MERKRLQGGSLFIIVFFIGVIVFCYTITALMLLDGGGNLLAVMVYSIFPVLLAPILVWEVTDTLPARVELYEDSCKLFIRGKLKQEVEFDSSVVADVTTRLGEVEFKVSPFSDRCYEPNIGRAHEECKPLCGIRFRKGDKTLYFCYEQGWRLKDFGRMWSPFIKVVRDHDMAMGDELVDYWSEREEEGLGGPLDIKDTWWSVKMEDLLPP